jgi:succinoglycan biosynthesis transport protein ExoP
MLEVSKNYSSVSPEFGYGAEPPPSPADYLSIATGVLRRQWPVIAICLTLTVAAAVFYYLRATPMYKATATVSLDTRKFQLFQQPSSLGEVSIDSSAAVESQVEILKSEKIALQVVKNLDLIDGTPQASSAGVLGGLFGARRPLSDFERTRAVLAVLQKRLTIKRLGIAWVIEISCESPDPERAAKTANAVADTYVTDQLEAKYDATRLGSVWLEGRIKELREQSLAAQRAVVEYKVKNNIIDAGGGRLIGDQQLAELNGQLAAARVQTSEMRSRLERINTIAQAASDDATVNASLTGVLSNETLTKLRAQYSELTNREAEFAAKYGRGHLSVVNLRTQMSQVRTAMLEEVRRLAESYRSDYELALNREKNLESDLNRSVSQSETTNRAQVILRELESTAQTSTGLYDSFVKRYRESLEQQSLPVSEARVITRAVPPSEREYKTLLKVLAGIFGGGITLGLGIAALREFSDRFYRTVSQVETRLHLNCIALVPLVKRSGNHQLGHLLYGKTTVATALASQTIDAGHYPVRCVVDSPLSGYAEAMRSIKLAIDLNSVVKTNKIIGLTSSLPKEGKSTISASLALSIGRTGARVILLDCDLRNPALTRALAPNSTAGFLEVLAGKLSLEDALWTDEAKLVSFLPAVVTSRFVQSNEIMASDITRSFFDQLRNKYDYIVVDLPPLAPVVDTRATTHLIDSYIFVIEWGGTRIDVVNHALGRASGIAENVLGVVLNKVDMSRIKSYDEKSGSYYKNKLYSQYGDFD